MVEPDAIDVAVLDRLMESVGGDLEFLTELLQTFFADTPNLFGAMRAALVAGKAEDFRRAAHSLKSNGAGFGAMQLSRMAKELEEMGKAGDLDGAEARIARAEEEYARVRAALEMATA